MSRPALGQADGRSLVSARNQTTVTQRSATALALENLKSGCKEMFNKHYTGGVKALQSLAGDVFFYDPYAPEGALCFPRRWV